jgi:hypothetical protein
MTNLDDWAKRWNIGEAAMTDLRLSLFGIDEARHLKPEPGMSEAAVQSRVRVAASRHGLRLWRNNVGALHDNERGIHLRYGLANDSPQINAICKSADLIGIRPRIIVPEMVGTVIGQFISIECKHERWRWSGDEHERAQANWAALVTSMGGEARFVTSADEV